MQIGVKPSAKNKPTTSLPRIRIIPTPMPQTPGALSFAPHSDMGWNEPTNPPNSRSWPLLSFCLSSRRDLLLLLLLLLLLPLPLLLPLLLLLPLPLLLR